MVWVWRKAKEIPADAAPGCGNGSILNPVSSIVTRRPPLLRFQDSSAWWLVAPAWRWLRHGPELRDRELIHVVDAIADTLRIHLASARAVLPDRFHARVDRLSRTLDEAVARDIPDLAAVFGIEAALNALYPPELAARRLWVVQDRFKRVAARQAFNEWWLRKVGGAPDGAVSGAQPSSSPRKDQGIIADVADAEASFEEARRAASRALEQHGLAEERLKTAQADRDAANDPSEEQTEAVEAARQDVEFFANERDITLTALNGSRRYRDAMRAHADHEAKRVARRNAHAAFDAAKRELAADPVDPVRQQAEAKAGEALKAAEEAEQAARNLLAKTASAVGVDPSALGTAVEAGPDTSSMLAYIHNHYMMGIARQKAERDLKTWLIHQGCFGIGICLLLFVLGWGIAALATGGCAFWNIYGPPYLVLLLVGLLGRIGALISIARRLQRAVDDNVLEQDSVQELVALRAGRAGIRLAMMSGTIFALLAWVMFASGVPALVGLGNGVFPTPLAEDRLERAAVDARAEAWSANLAVTRAEEKLAAEKARVAPPAARVTPANPAPVPPAISTAADELTKAQAAHTLAKARVEQAEAAVKVIADATGQRTGAETATWVSMKLVANTLGFVAGADLFLLLLWGFIAGFAERFVPDALDRIVGRANRAPGTTVNE